MKFLHAFILLVLSISVSAETITSTITSTMPCGDTKTVINELREDFKEIPIIIGIADDNANSLMSLWTNVNDGSWTLVATKDQISCIIGAGKSLRVVGTGKII